MARAAKTKAKSGDDGLTRHMTFRLSNELHARLKEVSGGKDIGEEIRRRLEASFDGEEIFVPLSAAVDLIRQFFGDWQSDAYAFGVLRKATEVILDKSRPPGEPKPTFNPESIADLIFRKTDTPEQAGDTVAGMVLRGFREQWQSISTFEASEREYRRDKKKG